MEIAGREFLVTGASSGIGAAIALELARRGGHVTLVGRSRERLERVAASIAAGGGSARVEAADLSRVDEVEALTSRLPAVPDVVVNNAGAGRWRAVDETSPGEAAEMMALPYLAAFELTRALLPGMIARRSGRVVCMTSLSAFTFIPGASGYAVARWAMRAFAGQLREDLRGTGVGVTLIAPSEVDSPYFDNNPGSHERVPRAVALLGGATTPEVVARATAEAISRERRQVIVPRQAEIMVRLTPQPVLDRLVRLTGWHRP